VTEINTYLIFGKSNISFYAIYQDHKNKGVAQHPGTYFDESKKDCDENENSLGYLYLFSKVYSSCWNKQLLVFYLHSSHIALGTFVW